ncbi:flagellin [Granulicella sibirica]|uniref:Flagellin n=1 Tax=Granulicella sibirica TaxID=2479048 RepID=A0A4V1L5N2_9BACT|nr:flagellin [Granulicella sibirica]RXH56354.1 Flagellin protein FlaA [Granulicella sibirica]
MSLGVLSNVAATYAQNNLNQTQASLQTVLQQLSSGSRINTGSDDAAGLSIASGLAANQAALTQSVQNASQGVSLLQTADGALSQVTSLLNRATTLATEASTGTLTTAQSADADAEFQNILAEIGNIGSGANFNSINVLTAATTNIVVTDGSAAGLTTIAAKTGVLTTASVGTATGGGAGIDLSSSVLTSQSSAAAALIKITDAIGDISNQRGTIGATVNQLTAAGNVASTEEVNLQSAYSAVTATNYGQATSQLANLQVLSQTGIAALAQANAVQQEILKLVQ